MRNLTLANQLTILRIVLIPAFVLLVVYGYLGSALLVFLTAGLTDALDGLIARHAGQRTSLGAWLDPMADKLLLVTTFVILTMPSLPLTNQLPLWLTVLACALTAAWFPARYWDLVREFDPLASWLVLLRGLTLVALLYQLTATEREPARSRSPVPSPRRT